MDRHGFDMDVARRVFIGVGLAGSAGWLTVLWHTPPDKSRLPARVRIAEFEASGQPLGVHEVPSVRRTDAEWKALLAVDQYTMTRRADTELAFTGEYWDFHGDGLYRCVCCETALFDSRSKFSSGTGWPSFAAPIAAENIAEFEDKSWGMWRTAVSCSRCDAHLGHVFDDGPAPSGKRYCVNSVAMRFRERRNLT